MKKKTYIIYFLIAVFSLINTACSPKLKKRSSGISILYPAPPYTARIQYLTSISGSSQIIKKQTSLQKTVVGEEKGRPIYKPYGVFIRNGKLYICDISVGGLEIIDLEKREFKYFVPHGAQKLKMALNSYVDSNNHLYIVDAELHKISVFDESGNYVSAFGKDENIKPTGIFIYEDNIYVADSENHRINVYSKGNNKFKYYFPKSKPGDESYLYKPTNLTVVKNKVYVSDIGSGNVKVYSLRGALLKTIGKYGRNIGEFVRPKGVAVDRDENLYVVDASFENVQIFNKEGQLLMFFGGHYEGPGGMWLPTSVIIDYDNVKYFEEYLDPNYKLDYLIIVVNQFGLDKINIYGRVNPISDELDSNKNN